VPLGTVGVADVRNGVLSSRQRRSCALRDNSAHSLERRDGQAMPM
jgi:hypothetical protein